MACGCWATPPCAAQVTRSFTEPVESSQVAAAEPGVIGKVLVKEGQRVSVGQTLGELDNEVLQRSLEIAALRAASDAKVRSTRARLKISKRKLEKLQPLLDQGHANHAEVEQAETSYEAALADHELAILESEEFRLEVSRIESQIRRRTIRSPVDGWITEIHRRPGEYIASNDPRFATVVQLDHLRVRFYLLADTVSRLQPGETVGLLLGEKKQPINAIVEFVSPVTNPDSGTARVDLLVDNPNLQIRSGTPCFWNHETRSSGSSDPR